MAITLKMKRVPCLTIYNQPTELEAMARLYPDAADKFVAQNPSVIEKWTILDKRVSGDFLTLQSAWLQSGGELIITDMHRPVLGEYGQLATYRRKPGLAAKPGWSTHIGFAFDFVMERLGEGKTVEQFLRFAENLGWARKENWHLQKLPRPFAPGNGKEFLEVLAAEEMPLTLEAIRCRLRQLGYDAERNMLTATMAFQQDFGLDADGVPGHNTQIALILATIEVEVS